MATGEMVTVTVQTYDGPQREISAWPTSVPGLYVTEQDTCPCNFDPDDKGDPAVYGTDVCWVVYPHRYGNFIAMCFPSSDDAAEFARVLDGVAPWEHGTPEEIFAAMQRHDWEPTWEAGRAFSGQRHPVRRRDMHEAGA